jgi:iron complex outermembrane receptor protein
LFLTVAQGIALAAAAALAATPSVEDLSHLSIEDLGNVGITSVSKAPQRLSDAPAAINVITHDDIMRSDATQIPGMR